MWHKKTSYIFVLGILLSYALIFLAHDQQIRRIDTQTSRVTLSRDAFLQIDVDFNIGIGTPLVYKGSGTLIAHVDGMNYALTANHLCNPIIPKFLVDKYTVQVKTVFVTDFSGEVYMGHVVFNSLVDDLCLIEFAGPTNAVVAPFAENPALINDKVYAFAAPTGFFAPHVIPLFDGYYIGNIAENEGESSAYTMPVVGGSSGGALLNSDGEIVGVIHSSLVDFHHITLASTHESIIAFLNEWFVLSGVQLLAP